jgi:nucleoside-diphosphate-sugar epimerase
MRVLVTGANGFVGSHLCHKLLQRGDSVRGLIRKTSDLSLLDRIPIQRVTGSLSDPASLGRATRGIDTVYHVAAKVDDWGTRQDFERINVEGTRSLLAASLRNEVQRFVYVSSAAVHSFIDAQDMDENSPQLPTPFFYCQSKRAAEALVSSCDIAATIVRPGDVYGPGDRTSLLKMSRLLETGRMPYLGRGDKLGAFTYVENLADGLILAGTSARAIGQAYVITDGIKLTWKGYLDKLCTALDVPAARFSISPSAAYAAASILEFTYRLLRLRQRPPITRYLVTHLNNDFCFRITKARRELGYEPHVGVDEAIRRTAEWYIPLVRGKNKP